MGGELDINYASLNVFRALKGDSGGIGLRELLDTTPPVEFHEALESIHAGDLVWYMMAYDLYVPPPMPSAQVTQGVETGLDSSENSPVDPNPRRLMHVIGLIEEAERIERDIYLDTTRASDTPTATSRAGAHLAVVHTLV